MLSLLGLESEIGIVNCGGEFSNSDVVTQRHEGNLLEFSTVRIFQIYRKSRRLNQDGKNGYSINQGKRSNVNLPVC